MERRLAPGATLALAAFGWSRIEQSRLRSSRSAFRSGHGCVVSIAEGGRSGKATELLFGDATTPRRPIGSLMNRVVEHEKLWHEAHELG
jgi:hypothetical protein